MSSVQQEAKSGQMTAERSAWTKPEFARLETGEAEARDGSGTDFAQGLS